MPRFIWHVRDSQLEIFRNYCNEQAKIFSEKPGFVFRRIIFFVSRMLIAEVSMQQIQAGIALIIDMHKNGCCCIKAKSHIKEIISLLKDD